MRKRILVSLSIAAGLASAVVINARQADPIAHGAFAFTHSRRRRFAYQEERGRFLTNSPSCCRKDLHKRCSRAKEMAEPSTTGT
jgi:hypothetical protein